MFKQGKVCWLWAGLLILAMALPLAGQETGTKVKVVVENASIRLKPSLDSEAIEENISVGTIYTANKKTGEWYEIKFESKLGVALLGYIHEMYVEVVGEAAPPEPEVRQPEVRQPERPPQPDIPSLGNPKMEIFAGGGMGFGSFLNKATTYSDSWTIGFINGYEEGEVQHKVNNPFGLGLSASYFLTDSLGLRLRLDFSFGQKISGGKSLYSADYSSGSWSASDQGEWGASGSLSAMPLSFDLVYRFPAGMFTPYVNAGVSFFLASFKADTTVGWAYAWYINPSTMTYDYADVPASIDEKLNGLGFNLGAGFDFHLGPGLAVTVDAAYFIGKKSSLGWYVAPNQQYYFNYYTSSYVSFDEAYAQNFANKLSKVQVNLSFFKILVGIKLFL